MKIPTNVSGSSDKGSYGFLKNMEMCLLVKYLLDVGVWGITHGDLFVIGFGRTVLWKAALDGLEFGLLGGVGFRGGGGELMGMGYVGPGAGEFSPHFTLHNGYLEMAVSFGIIAAVIIAVMLLWKIYQYSRLCVGKGNVNCAADAMMGAYLVGFAAINVVESAVFFVTSVQSVIAFVFWSMPLDSGRESMILVKTRRAKGT